MPEIIPVATTRRDFIKSTGTLAAATTLAGMTIPFVHAAENNTIQVALPTPSRLKMALSNWSPWPMSLIIA